MRRMIPLVATGAVVALALSACGGTGGSSAVAAGGNGTFNAR